MTIRTKMIRGSGPYTYEQKSVRVGKKVVTKHVRYIGKGQVGNGANDGVVPKVIGGRKVTPKTRSFIEEVERKQPKTAREALALYRKHDPSLRELNELRKAKNRAAAKADKKRLSRKSPGPLDIKGF